LSYAILEGYQTFDAIGAIVVGGVIIVSINLKYTEEDFDHKKILITKAGWLAGLALFLVYAGLIFSGSLMHGSLDANVSRTELLQSMSLFTLGPTGKAAFSVLVSLACFTTAVGIVTGTADFVKSRFSGSQVAYFITALIGAVLGVLMGRLEVSYIIAVALPALMFIYPLTIVLILLNVVPDRYSSPAVFRSVVIATLVFSVPDFLDSLGYAEAMEGFNAMIPMSDMQLGWLLPALLAFGIANGWVSTVQKDMKEH
jgi:LIVCS family branched-chain amino acid:cation transporter